jgi:hypothetical protein
MPTSRAADKVSGRQTWYSALTPLVATGGAAADRLAARFQSFADTIQTRLDTATATGPALGGSLEAQVDRALSQVLRQAPADSSGAYLGQGAAPLVAQGLSMATVIGGAGGPPAIAPAQAALLQEARLVKGDALSVLDTLQPLSAFADPSDVTAVTAVVRAETDLLVQEFARTTLRPRAQRVRVLLGGLLGWNPGNPPAPNLGDAGALITLLNLGGPLVPTLLVEQQLASQTVLTSDVTEFFSQWETYRQTQAGISTPWEAQLGPRFSLSGLGNLGPGPITGGPLALGPRDALARFRLAVVTPAGTPLAGSYAERLIQANLLLPTIGQDAAHVGGALDAIGLSAGEQESTFIELQSLVDMDLISLTAAHPARPITPGALTDPLDSYFAVRVRTTVTDILDWAASMADAKTLDLLNQAGQLGLNLIADQADELFWQVLAILYPGTLMVELGDAQVQTELLTLARDLELLADLAV